ncbi:MAG: hypothetical protein NTX79_00995 [Candidatus Micrarchaeota archaeon]|nr:hypothetical protein [Candidatus Micrarchaeota archaeon]
MDEGKGAQALKKGEVDIRLKRMGMYQVLPFKIERRDTPGGKVPYLCSDRAIEMPELVRIANEYGLPVCAQKNRVLPRGKMEKDFAGL